MWLVENSSSSGQLSLELLPSPIQPAIHVLSERALGLESKGLDGVRALLPLPGCVTLGKPLALPLLAWLRLSSLRWPTHTK